MEYCDNHKFLDHKLFTCKLQIQDEYLGHNFLTFKPHFFTDKRFSDLFKNFWQECIDDFMLEIAQKNKK